QSLALARRLAHPFSLVLALLISADFHLLRKEGQTSLSRADECLQLAIENGFEHMSRMASAHRARALIELDRAEEGIDQLKRDVAGLRAAGSEFQVPSFLTALGYGYSKVGQVAEGLTAVAEGLTVSEKTGERWFDADLYRLKGELLLGK